MDLATIAVDVERRMSGGEPFATVEDRINTTPGLTDEQRAALWLLAWSRIPRRAQRRCARSYVALVRTDGRRVPLRVV